MTVDASTPIAETIREQRIIICEGIDDKRFFSAFIAERKLTGLQVMRPAGGKDGFGERLTEIEGLIVPHGVKAILLIVDRDNVADGNFKKVAKQINKLNLYGVPTAFKQKAKKTGRPAIGILDVPDGKEGNVDTLIFDILSNTDGYKQVGKCVETYMRCSKAKNWPAGSQAKMKLQCLIAGSCEPNPKVRTFEMWQPDKGFRPLLKNAGFNTFETFLKKFQKW